AVAGDCPDIREPPADLGGHVLPELHRAVVLLLLRRELLVVQVLAEPGADLHRRAESRARIAHGKGVVESLDDAVAARKLLVPALHELVADPPLLRSERGQDLGPLR